MSGTSHPLSVTTNNHAITGVAAYATIAARDADSDFNTTSTNLNKVVRVEDADGSGTIGYFILTSITPTWESMGDSLNDEFIELADTPSTFTGQGSLILAVNSGATAVEFTDTITVSGTSGLTVGASIPFSGSAGVLTLQNIDAIDATTETTLEAALDFSFVAGTPVDNQVAIWTGSETIEGDSDLTFDGLNLTAGGSISAGTEFQQAGATILIGDSTSFNLFAGFSAGNATTTAGGLTAVGNNALNANTTGDDNTGVGTGALKANLGGSENTAVGAAALILNTSGSFNDAFGSQALAANTTGTNNAAFGNAALELNTTGSGNVAIGIGALEKNILGRRNTALGVIAGVNIASATLTGENTLIGYNTGQGITTGVQNTILGANVIGLATTLSNNIILADGAGVTRLQFDSSGDGTIGGGLQVTGAFKDSSGGVGTNGQILSSTVTGTNWIAAGGNVTTSATLTDNFLVRGNGTIDIDIGSISMDSGGTRLRAGAGTELLPTYSFTSNTNRGMYDEGSSLRFSDDGFDVLELIAPSLAANWLQITAAQDDDSAGSIKIIPAGADADIEMSISSKGSQTLNLNTGTGGGEVAIGKGDGLEVGSNGEVGIGIGASTPSGLDGLTLQIRASTIIFGNPNTKTQVEWLSPASNNQLLIGVNDTGSNNAEAFVLAPVSSDLVLSTLKTVNVSGNYPYINFGYATVAAETSGLVVNYLPTATTDTVSLSAFVAGVASTSNPTVTTVGAATFSTNDIIQITGTEQFENDGLFEVLTHAANLLTIRGIGTTAVVEDFTGDQFIANTSDSATITKVTLSVLRSGTDGIWESASGSVTGFSFSDLILSSTGVVKTGTPVDNQLSVWTGASTIEGTTGLTFDGSTFTTTGAGVFGGDLTISTDGSSTVTPRLLGFTDYSAGEAAKFRFGDDANVVQNAFGNAMDIYSFHTLRLLGDRSTTTALSFSTESNIGVHVIGTTVGSPVLVVSGASSQTADLFQVRNNSGTVLSVFDDEGNLGILTSSPNAALHVVGTGTVNTGLDIAQFRNSINGLRINIIDENITGSLPPMIESEAGFGLGLAASSGELKFFAGGKAIGNLSMLLSTSGLLGIGELSPDTRLHITMNTSDSDALLTLENIGTNAGVTTTFVGSQTPDGNVTGAGGDIYFKDSAALSNMFFNKEATTGTNWEGISLIPSNVHELFSTAEYEALGTASVITTSDVRSLVFKATVTSSTRHTISSQDSELQFIDPVEGNQMIYTGSSTFITAATGGDIVMRNAALIAGISGTQLFDYEGEGALSGVDIIEIGTSSNLIFWHLGALGRISTAEVGPVLSIRSTNIISSTAGLVLNAVNGFEINGVFIDQIDKTGIGAALFQIKSESYKEGRGTFITNGGNLYSDESLVRIDAGLPSDYRVQVLNQIMILNGTAAIFDTSGTTGTFTTVVNNSISATTITGVTDSSGVASFTVASAPLLGSLATVSGFTTNTDYNTTGIVTARTATTFEIDYVAFGATEAGSYLVTGVTVTSTAHGLTQSTGVTLDTTLSTDYDGGFLLYNIQTNSFDVPATFTSTKAGAWSTKGLDETDPRVRAFNNPGTADSKVIAFGFTNANTDSTTITNGTYAAIDASTFTENGVTQRFKLTNATTALFELTALEDFDGFLTGSLTAVKSGSTADYRFAMSTNGSIPVFASANYVPMEVKTTKVNIALEFSVSLSQGDTIQIMVAGDGTSDALTITDLVFGIK